MIAKCFARRKIYIIIRAFEKVRKIEVVLIVALVSLVA